MKALSPPDGPVALVPEADAFRNSLRAEDQVVFDELYKAASENYKMMENVGLIIPLEKMLFAMLIEQQKQIEALKIHLAANKGTF